ncbi:MFS general substrate transporter [Plenodomus tracheiphilus IPT5]|uniref:MFS general substrate transporter n=1 Tax=Plenodomus tracheiphilus IPT5 TaxID=1408161 RepID=A0A6A7ALJ5_9PLEO|nr:MFS general substrate transporter [Plenodomus tracheiphilus IPT5]
MVSSSRSGASKEDFPSFEKPPQGHSNLTRHPTYEGIQLEPRTISSNTNTNTTPTHQQQQHNLDLARTTSIAETLSPFREFLFVTLLCSAQLVTQIALLNTLIILHIIGPSLGITSPGVLSWLIAGYSLTVGTFILLSGRCGDLFGYKPLLIIGFAWFAVWNIVAGFSVYVDGNGGQVLFIFARVLGGIGLALLLPNALGLSGATYRNGRKKDMVFSLFGACANARIPRITP